MQPGVDFWKLFQELILTKWFPLPDPVDDGARNVHTGSGRASWYNAIRPGSRGLVWDISRSTSISSRPGRQFIGGYQELSMPMPVEMSPVKHLFRIIQYSAYDPTN
jgi:hypothetical protein